MQNRQSTKEEMMQQIIYNIVLYLPLQKLMGVEKLTIGEIVEKARDYKDSGNNVEVVTLEMLDA